MQETIDDRGAGHMDMFGELKTSLEGARGDALIEHFALFPINLVRRLLGAANGQRGFPGLNRQFILGKAGHRNGDPVGVFAGPLNVVGRIGRRAVDAGILVEQREQPIEADGRTIERREVKITHIHILLVKRHGTKDAPIWRRLSLRASLWTAQPSNVVRRSDTRKGVRLAPAAENRNFPRPPFRPPCIATAAWK